MASGSVGTETVGLNDLFEVTHTMDLHLFRMFTPHTARALDGIPFTVAVFENVTAAAVTASGSVSTSASSATRHPGHTDAFVAETSHRSPAGENMLSTYTWPAASLLAQYIVENPHIVADQTVLDLGCGCGLVAITAALCGAATVIATDADHRALALTQASWAYNCSDTEGCKLPLSSNLQCALLDWTRLYEKVFLPSPAAEMSHSPPARTAGACCPSLVPPLFSDYWLTLRPQVRCMAGMNCDDAGHSSLVDIPALPTVLLGADVLFDSKLFEPLMATVATLLRSAAPGTHPFFLTAYQVRSSSKTIAHLLEYFGLEGACVESPRLSPMCLRFARAPATVETQSVEVRTSESTSLGASRKSTLDGVPQGDFTLPDHSQEIVLLKVWVRETSTGCDR